jgi:hypothetical protein
MGDSCKSSFVIPVPEAHRRLRTVPSGVTTCHLINSLHNASMYGRRGLSLNVGSRSLPTTISSSACARLCTCGKSVRARKKEIIENAVFIIVLSIKCMGLQEHARCLNRLKRGIVSHVFEPLQYNASPEYIDPVVTIMTSSCFSRSEPTKFSNSCRCSDANDCTAVPSFYDIQYQST